MAESRILHLGKTPLRFNEAIPLSLYIHLPWCIKKCPYCDFNSHTMKELPEEEYIADLLRDCEAALPYIWNRPIRSIFIGGGTPSLFSGKAIDSLLCQLRALLTIPPNTEITLEANPGASDAERFALYRAAGVNRLSIGVQSFDPNALKALGRIHSGDEAVKAFAMARAAGFESINLDIMYALPNQSLNQAMADLEQAISLDPGHISWYQLTLEPNTFFHKHPPSLPIDDAIIEMEEQGQALLSQNAYHRYEISAYGKTHQCQHNLNYWTFGDYLGIGAGAHSKLTLPAEGKVIRMVKHKHPTKYMDPAHAYLAEQTLISSEDLPIEYMLNAARLIKGFHLEDFARHTGLASSTILSQILACQEKGLINLKDGWVEPTELGLRFTNDRISEFLP